MKQKPDYGIDAPGVIRNLLVIGGALIITAFIFPVIRIGSLTILWKSGGLSSGISISIGGVLMLVYSMWGKFRHRDRMLKMIHWRGDEQVLDVGTGRGLLLVGAARQLKSGKACGIDVWSTKDLSGNSLERTQSNIEIEGVKDKITLKSDDARKLSFPDATFNVILSNLCIHNIPNEEGRAQACREIARVLKPGGVAIISDFIHTGFYQKIFRESGLQVSRKSMSLVSFPPLHIIRAEKR